ncbi:MAG: sulfatase-like hydrolase/transferase, partial [Anaerolineae bacterium]|nr:sulfatase-like hydrolase/transferase [Anaerolineae bacterium]
MDTRPNIVFLLNDHQAYYRHGWDGGVRPRTPHFDRLASGGIRFQRCYCATPLCGPDRRTLLTGLYAHTHGQHHNETDAPYAHQTYLDALAEAGYSNAYYGKWHAGPGTAREHRCAGFTMAGYGNPYLTDEYHAYLARHGLPQAEHLVERAFAVDNHRGMFPKLKEGARYRCEYTWCGEHALGLTVTPKETHEAFYLAHLACAQLEEWARAGAARPFHLRVDFWGPHQPYFPTPEYAALYDPTEIPVYGSFRSDLRGKPDLYHRERNVPLGIDNRLVIPNPLPWDAWQRILARCYAHITMIDAAGGLILDKLEELGLAEQTMVVWAADHGDAIACHGGHFDKSSSMPEEVLRTPLAIRYPGRVPPGQVSGHLVSHVDLAPTLLDAAGTGGGAGMHGRSLLPVCAGRGAAWRDSLLFETYGHGYGEEIVSRGVIWG